LELFIPYSYNQFDLEATGAHFVNMFFDNKMILNPNYSGRIAANEANTLGQITQQSMRAPFDGFLYVLVPMG